MCIAFHFAIPTAPQSALQPGEKTCPSLLSHLQGTAWFLFLVPLTFLKNKYFYLFCCQAVSSPCSNQKGWGQLQLDPVWRLVLRSADYLSETHGLYETLLFPDTLSIPNRNAAQRWQSHGKQQDLAMMATWGWSLGLLLFLIFASLFTSTFLKRTAMVSKTS